MSVKRSRLSAPVFWCNFWGFPRDFYSISFIFLSKIAIFHICQSTQNGGPGDFGDPKLTKFIKNRVLPFCGFKLHMSPTKPPWMDPGRQHIVSVWTVRAGGPGVATLCYSKSEKGVKKRTFRKIFVYKHFTKSPLFDPFFRFWISGSQRRKKKNRIS